MSQFSGVDETLTLAVERLERLHEVGERSRLGRFVRLLVDRQNFLELVLLLAYTRVRQLYIMTQRTCHPIFVHIFAN